MNRSIVFIAFALLWSLPVGALARERDPVEEQSAPKSLGSGARPETSTVRLREVDRLLRGGDWAAAETAARAGLAAQVQERMGSEIPPLLTQLAVAEAGQGRTADALWHWQVAQGLGMGMGCCDLSRYGAPGELLTKSSRRSFDAAPSGLVVRRAGDGGPPLTPARKLSGEDAKLPVTFHRFPRGIRAQLIVDQEGGVRDPVLVESTFPALAYVVLEAVHGWRFMPAQVNGAPVASLFEIRIPPERPLDQLLDLRKSPLAEPFELLKAGRYAEARKRVAKIWAQARDDAEQTPTFLGVALFVKALADAGLGQEDSAICRFQAAQTLEPRLYGANLSAFGAPGSLLMRHPWAIQGPACWGGLPDDPGVVQRTPHGEVSRPEPLKRPPPVFPEYARRAGIQGTVVVEGILTATGVIRDALLLEPSASAGLDAEALDTVCDWRFRPATLEGKPVKVYYTLTVNFQVKSR
ncbi:MAG: energy transducer TonB [Acidobacteriota bacterium]|nr:energy transducer TonB [Acidobacteriota bacterium]